MDVVTLGETMVLFAPDAVGNLKYIHNFKKQLAGAESNFAIGVARLGIKCGWISKLGADPFGDYIKSFVAGEGVDVSRVIQVKNYPTAVFFKEFASMGEPRVYYYRKGSAFSTITPDDLDEDYIAGAKILHVTGITPALSDSARKTIFKAIEIAKRNGLTISFDPNVRKKLWTKEEAVPVMLDIIKQSDVLLPGLSEMRYIFGDDNMPPEAVCKKALEMGVSVIALKMGKSGCIVSDKKQTIAVTPSKIIENPVDPVGTGDGFNAGFIYGMLNHMTLGDSARLACDVGAYVATVIGDVEGLPAMNDIEVFRGTCENVTR